MTQGYYLTLKLLNKLELLTCKVLERYQLSLILLPSTQNGHLLYL